MQKVSIIVLNWNGKENLRICLNSIRKVNYSNLETIVVDNASYDGSVEMVRLNYPWVKLISNKKNLGYSYGNNIGIKNSSGKYVFILNNDTKVPEDFLFPLVNLMESDKKIGCVQPQLLYGSNPSILNAVGSFYTSSGFLYHFGYRKSAKLAMYSKKMPIYTAKGAAMLLRIDALKKTGLFDEDFFIFFEETDLCHRIWLAGYKVVYEPASHIFHFEAVDTSLQMDDYTRTYLILRNRIVSYLKNLELINLVKVLFFISVIYASFFAYNIIRFKFNLAYAVISAVFWNIKQLPNTLKKRYLIQHKLRKVSDHDLFKIIKKDPPLGYYYHLFFGNLKNYKDEKAIY